MLDLLTGLEPIKAITLWQPWASLMAAGVKRHETRHWDTRHRGLIAIHASKRLDLAGGPDRLCDSALGRRWLTSLPGGAVVAIGELNCTRAAETITGALTAADIEAGNFAPGRFAWEILNVRALRRPIPALGRQGLWNWTPPTDLEARLGPVLDHVMICHRMGWGLKDRAA